jgi:hypothetical protein
MLRAKFSGQVTGISLGSVSPVSLWTEAEHPSIQFANV